MKSKLQKLDTSAHKPWRSSILLLISLVSFYFTVPAFGEPSLTLAPSTPEPSTAPEKPPPPPKTGMPISSTTLSKQLSDMMIGAAIGVANAAERDPPLETSGLVLILAFALKTQGGAGVGYSVAPIGVETEGKVSSSEVQRITLKFEDTPTAK